MSQILHFVSGPMSLLRALPIPAPDSSSEPAPVLDAARPASAVSNRARLGVPCTEGNRYRQYCCNQRMKRPRTPVVQTQ